MKVFSICVFFCCVWYGVTAAPIPGHLKVGDTDLVKTHQIEINGNIAMFVEDNEASRAKRSARATTRSHSNHGRKRSKKRKRIHSHTIDHLTRRHRPAKNWARGD